MRKKFKVKEFTTVRVTFIATDETTDVEAEAIFENVEDALRIMQNPADIESVEIDTEVEGETTTKFNLKTKQSHEQSTEPSSDSEPREAEIVEN